MRPALALVALVALGCAPGCGTASGVGDDADSGSADTARFEFVLTRTDKQGRVVMTGVADFPQRSAAFRTSFEEGADPGESYNGLATPGDEFLVFGDTSYTQWTVREKDTYWVKSTEESPSGAVPGLGPDPKTSYELILAAGDEPERVGDEEVRDTPTVHYKVNVDPAKLAERMAFLDVSRPSAFPVDVWVDADERVRRLRVTEKFEGGSTTLGYEFFDFGVEVDLERPTDRVISETRLDELTRPSAEELRELCEEEIPEEVCAEAEKEGE
jgi:hypothetical protein